MGNHRLRFGGTLSKKNPIAIVLKKSSFLLHIALVSLFFDRSWILRMELSVPNFIRVGLLKKFIQLVTSVKLSKSPVFKQPYLQTTRPASQFKSSS